MAARYIRGRIPVVNPDDIARGDGSRPPVSLMEAGRIALRERRLLLEMNTDFAVETTLTGNSEIELMRAAKARGYKVNLIFVAIDDVQTSIARVGERVRRGGHDVPEADLLRRFDRSMTNLEVAAAIADRLIVIDNRGLRRRLILLRAGASIRFVARPWPSWLPALAL